MDNLGKEELQILMTLLDQDRDGKIGMHNLW
jgi:Ca2+-binding EF-hand superfamily protein